MTRQEAVQKLATTGCLSIAHAEDLYDSFFPKPVVPQYVVEWYEENKEDFETNLFNDIYNISNVYPGDNLGEFADWLMADDSHALTTLINMNQFGYEVEEEPRYTVRVKGVDGYGRYLNRNLDNQYWFLASDNETISYRTKHTHKELEEAVFGWVFDCEGVEVKEVDDGND